MNSNYEWGKKLCVTTLICAVALAGPTWANDKSQSAGKEGASSQGTVSSSVSQSVKEKGQEEIDKKREELVKEAITAITETEKALKALEEKKPQEALQALAKVTGQLEILVSRDPDLAFVPIDVETVIYDVHADLEKIEEAKEQVEEFFEKGEIQKARALLSHLASELVIRTISLPLSTYPDAVKAVVPLIDQGKIEEAKAALQAVLETVVVTDTQIIPLPVIRAESLIHKAEALAKKLETPEIVSSTDSKNEKNENQKQDQGTSLKQQVLDHLDKARYQLRMAKALGYGIEHKRYEEMEKHIQAIEEKIRGEESSGGLFDRLKRTLSKFKENLYKE